ncbi:hypothetical protein SUGI_0201670 [Cryptomeria japonica]|uniref:uncharacterized protein LOC131049111 n=1 Tax=Cryptomeria japonica TaxID=3369 RepID=UPI002408D133|nr:uncharacterized protein LOC131049111 [Cryptomeria japonica]XP_059073998.1 uncharacterized protein LOC131049111 [Cryptomeria japonica]XP_059073999.1 uncharacterized protein LOC131049111 [Cryptomeria japonica]XP_059074000.1 uncharacterized protein LOC131049111 [Cryptomeria japonica]GLJ12966.1 hypothetical protein SUGI_0201670 [Cryptomeria japonica]
MGSTSKDLLHLEQNSNITALEKSLFMLENARDNPQKKENAMPSSSKSSLRTTAVPESQVLGRLKGFLQVIDEANRKLQTNDKPREDYDIEVLTGEEEHYIEMDLALGVADLHTPEALAAAESALASQREICVPAISDDSHSSYCTEATDDSESETKVNNDLDSYGNCDTEDDDDSYSSFELEANRTSEKFRSNDSGANKLGQFQKSGVKRLACLGKGQKRRKIEMLK